MEERDIRGITIDLVCVCQIRERPTVDVICGVVNLEQKKNEHKITQTIREFSK